MYIVGGLNPNLTGTPELVTKKSFIVSVIKKCCFYINIKLSPLGK